MRLKNPAATTARIMSAMMFFIVLVLYGDLAASRADLAQSRPIAPASAKQAKGFKPTPKAVTEIQTEANRPSTALVSFNKNDFCSAFAHLWRCS
jgi:hypothetical protein